MIILLDDSLAKPQTISLFKQTLDNVTIGVLDGGDSHARLAKYFADFIVPLHASNPEDYFVLLEEVCHKYNADVLVPRRYLPNIPKLIGKTKVLAEDQLSSKICDDKCLTYETLKNDFNNFIPIYSDCADIEKTISCLEELHSHKQTQIMLKKKTDIGGSSFKKICSTNLNDIYSVIEKKNLNNYITGEILIGNMVSVDVFSDQDGLIHQVKREKIHELRVIYDQEDLNGICEELYHYFNFEYAVNMQFMRSSIDHKLKLLEINPRISGGIHMASKLLEVNIPEILIKKLLDIKIENVIDFEPKHKIVADVSSITVLE